MAAAKKHSLTGPERAARKHAATHTPTVTWGAPPEGPSGEDRVVSLVQRVGTGWTDILGLVVACRYGLTVSATRDGGALSLSLLTDAGPQKRYAGHPDELDELVRALRAYLTQVVQGQMVLPGT